jgi:hypothetical protein
MSVEIESGFDQWAIVELMGHVRIAGRVREVELFGSKQGRCDIPDSNGGFTTQYFNGSSLYRLTPTTEEIARNVAKSNQPEPVYLWDLRKQLEAVSESPVDVDEEGDHQDDLEGDDHPF